MKEKIEQLINPKINKKILWVTFLAFNILAIICILAKLLVVVDEEEYVIVDIIISIYTIFLSTPFNNSNTPGDPSYAISFIEVAFSMDMLFLIYLFLQKFLLKKTIKYFTFLVILNSTIIISIISFYIYQYKTSVPHYDLEHIKEINKEFEQSLQKYGTELEIEKMDTRDWKTFTSQEMGFSFQYPADWHVVTKYITDDYFREFYTSREQFYYRKNGSSEDDSIKARTEYMPIICVVKSEEIYNKIKDKKVGFKDCDITFDQYFTTYKGEKKSSVEIWFDLHKEALNSNSTDFEKEDCVAGYFTNYVSSGCVNSSCRGSFFLYSGFKISIMNGNEEECIKHSNNNVFTTLIQTIKKFDN